MDIFLFVKNMLEVLYIHNWKYEIIQNSELNISFYLTIYKKSLIWYVSFCFNIR